MSSDYTVEELRALALEGASSGPSGRATMSDFKAEARRLFDEEKRRTAPETSTPASGASSPEK